MDLLDSWRPCFSLLLKILDRRHRERIEAKVKERLSVPGRMRGVTWINAGVHAHFLIVTLIVLLRS